MSARRKLLGTIEGSKVYADEILSDADRRAMAPTLDWVAVPSHVTEGPAQVRHKRGWLVCEAPADDYARLIAAAPELLAALKIAQFWLDVDGRYDMQGINAAIAKAEGR